MVCILYIFKCYVYYKDCIYLFDFFNDYILTKPSLDTLLHVDQGRGGGIWAVQDIIITKWNLWYFKMGNHHSQLVPFSTTKYQPLLCIRLQTPTFFNKTYPNSTLSKQNIVQMGKKTVIGQYFQVITTLFIKIAI